MSSTFFSFPAVSVYESTDLYPGPNLKLHFIAALNNTEPTAAVSLDNSKVMFYYDFAVADSADLDSFCVSRGGGIVPPPPPPPPREREQEMSNCVCAALLCRSIPRSTFSSSAGAP